MCASQSSTGLVFSSLLLVNLSKFWSLCIAPSQVVTNVHKLSFVCVCVCACHGLYTAKFWWDHLNPVMVCLRSSCHEVPTIVWHSVQILNWFFFELVSPFWFMAQKQMMSLCSSNPMMTMQSAGSSSILNSFVLYRRFPADTKCLSSICELHTVTAYLIKRKKSKHNLLLALMSWWADNAPLTNICISVQHWKNVVEKMWQIKAKWWWDFGVFKLWQTVDLTRVISSANLVLHYFFFLNLTI